MKKYNKNIIISIILITIAIFLVFSEQFFFIEFLNPIYSYKVVVFVIGIAYWIREYSQKKKASKENDS